MTVKELQLAVLSGKKFEVKISGTRLYYDENHQGGFCVEGKEDGVYDFELEMWDYDWQPLEEKPWEPTFLEPVLVRNGDRLIWKYAEFSFKSGGYIYVNGGIQWTQCIPYKGNEHKLGKAK